MTEDGKPQQQAERTPGHIAPVRAAVHRKVTAERWGEIIAAVSDVACVPGKLQVVAAQFLAQHAPTPDEMASTDPYAQRTLLAGPEVVDEWVARLSHVLGAPPELLPEAIAAALKVAQMANEEGKAK